MGYEFQLQTLLSIFLLPFIITEEIHSNFRRGISTTYPELSTTKATVKLPFHTICAMLEIVNIRRIFDFISSTLIMKTVGAAKRHKYVKHSENYMHDSSKYGS